MTPARWYVWEWLNAEGRPVYLGRGRRTANGDHPADILWDRRRTQNNELGKWLQSLSEPPRRNIQIVGSHMYKSEADAIYDGRKLQLDKLNISLLQTRDFGSKIGGGDGRGVLDPNGDFYESVRAAARDPLVSKFREDQLEVCLAMEINIRFDKGDGPELLRDFVCQLAAMFGGASADVAAPAAPKKPRGKKEESADPATAATATATPAPTAATPAPVAATTPAATPAPAAVVPPPATNATTASAGGFTIDHIREKIIEATKILKPAGVVEIVTATTGVGKASQVPVEKYDSLMVALQTAMDAANVAG
jgi:hypothetical protein